MPTTQPNTPTNVTPTQDFPVAASTSDTAVPATQGGTAPEEVVVVAAPAPTEEVVTSTDANAAPAPTEEIVASTDTNASVQKQEEVIAPAPEKAEKLSFGQRFVNFFKNFSLFKKSEKSEPVVAAKEDAKESVSVFAKISTFFSVSIPSFFKGLFKSKKKDEAKEPVSQQDIKPSTAIISEQVVDAEAKQAELAAANKAAAEKTAAATQNTLPANDGAAPEAETTPVVAAL
ncbi:MAG: hypothetical protein Q8R79_07585 [Legionellaceae bacterium]|nr:hypothetical protein [Legionellaceae bacterium]